MDMKWILAIVAASLFIGALVGVITTNFASFIGATVFSFAVIFSVVFYLINKNKKGIGSGDEEASPDGAETEEVNSFQMVDEPVVNPLERDRMIETYIRDLGLNRDKAENLYDAGYSRWSDFSEAIPEDLLMVEGINPTVARRIITRVRSRD
jgi:hypothetical protein